MNYGEHTGFVWPRLTPAVRALLIANVAVFLANALLADGLAPWLGLSWDGMWRGYGLGIVRLVTYQFVHDFHSVSHILFNMLALYFFGTFVEEAIGQRRLLRLYFVAGVVGGLLQVLLQVLYGSTSVLTIGASGAIYGILVYAAFMAPRMRVIFFIFPIEMRWLVGVLVGIGVYMMFIELRTGYSTGTAHGGHLGGALWGFLAYRYRGLGQFQWSLPGKLQRWNAGRTARKGQEQQRILDELLAKVHREGIGSLTPAERRFLDKASQDARRK